MAYTVYDEFAWFFDRYRADGYLEDVREGFESFFLSRFRPGSRILDVCCGTGQMAGLLCERRFDVVGVDGSARMLELAAANAPDARFERADVRETLPAGPFAAAISLFDSINHFASADELAAVFANVFGVLSPGGLFLFDINTAAGFEEAGEETYADVESKRVCVVKTQFNHDVGRGASDVTLFNLSDETWCRRDFKIEEFLHDDSEISQILRRTGFVDVEVLSAEDDFGMHRGYGRLFFLATKASKTV